MMNIKRDILYVTLEQLQDEVDDGSLCSYMWSCPEGPPQICEECVGVIDIKELETIREPLTRDNLEEAIAIWQVLLK